MTVASRTEHVVAMDVGGTTIKAALVDREGRTVGVERRPTAADGGADAAREAVIGLIAELVGRRPGAVAVGLAVPGLVHETDGTVRQAVNLGWHDVPIGALAGEAVGLPVVVMHDVRSGALAEGLFGAARGARDYLVVALGTGIGAAVVLDGRPYSGAHGMGGELGHVAVEPRGPLCGCGRPGCLEALASAGYVSRRYEAMAGAPATAEEVAALAADGDPTAGEVWRGALDALAMSITNYATLLDPELVVIGGGMASAGPSLFDPLRARLAALARFADPPPVVAAALGPEAGRQGAAIAAWRLAGLPEEQLKRWQP
jgi:glucokinase